MLSIKATWMWNTFYIPSWRCRTLLDYKQIPGYHCLHIKSRLQTGKCLDGTVTVRKENWVKNRYKPGNREILYPIHSGFEICSGVVAERRHRHNTATNAFTVEKLSRCSSGINIMYPFTLQRVIFITSVTNTCMHGSWPVSSCFLYPRSYYFLKN